MYVPADDQVVELVSMPPPEPGAPMPVLYADEGELEIAYYVDAREEPWVTAFLTAPIVGITETEVALVRFQACRSHTFGAPTEEAIEGHPLHGRGLTRFSFNEVLRSSWIRALERMDAIHPAHNPQYFAGYRHFLIAFHDSTFECVARGCSFELVRGEPFTAIAKTPG